MDLITEVLAASEDQPEPDEPVSQSAAFQIFVRNMAGNNVSVFVEADELIEDVKLKIRDRTGTHPVQQRLIFEGKPIRRLTRFGRWCFRQTTRKR